MKGECSVSATLGGALRGALSEKSAVRRALESEARQHEEQLRLEAEQAFEEIVSSKSSLSCRAEALEEACFALWQPAVNLELSEGSQKDARKVHEFFCELVDSWFSEHGVPRLHMVRLGLVKPHQLQERGLKPHLYQRINAAHAH